MNAKRTEPSRRLFDPSKETQHAWTSSAATDLKARFEQIRRAMQKAPSVALVRKAAK
jgi:hypothetical protein